MISLGVSTSYAILGTTRYLERTYAKILFVMHPKFDFNRASSTLPGNSVPSWCLSVGLISVPHVRFQLNLPQQE